MKPMIGNLSGLGAVRRKLSPFTAMRAVDTGVPETAGTRVLLPKGSVDAAATTDDRGSLVMVLGD